MPRPAATTAALTIRFIDIAASPLGCRSPALRAGDVQLEWLGYRLRLLRVAHVDTGRSALDRPGFAVDRGPCVTALIVGCGIGESERDAVDGTQPDGMDQGRIAIADHGADPSGRVTDADVGVVTGSGARDRPADVLSLT